ncbi:MAG: ribonuclease HII [Candidatus Asgardarchaeia archaeon]
MPKHNVIGGIDEAGRGPVIGPMVICGISFDEGLIEVLMDMGVKDSKKLSRKAREDIVRKLGNLDVKVVLRKVSAQEIDERFERGMNLNDLELIEIGRIVENLGAKRVYIDCPDVNVNRFKSRLYRIVGENYDLIVAHKADLIYPAVSLASIVAKVRRDELIQKIKEIYGDFGSGYPSDYRTVEFLKGWYRKFKSWPPFVRKSWATTVFISKEMEKRQAHIDDFY